MTRWGREFGLLSILLPFGCGGDPPNEGGSGAATDSASSSGATLVTAGMTQASAATETDDATGGGASSDDGSTGESATGGGGPGIDLECMEMGGIDSGDEGVICFYDVVDPGTEPSANLVYELVDLDGKSAIYLRLIFAPWFCDNTYGVNAIGWPRDHKFRDLVGSDHAEFTLHNVGGELVLHFKLDYISEDPTAPSGYRALGVWGGEGKVEAGDETAILAANSSISRNLNERGYDTYLEDSPATDENYTPNADAPNWDYRVVYEVWLDAEAFPDEGDGALAQACVQFIHASPSKLMDNTMEVIPDSCPPGWGCFEEDGCHCDAPTDPDHPDQCDPTDGFPPEG